MNEPGAGASEQLMTPFRPELEPAPLTAAELDLLRAVDGAQVLGTDEASFPADTLQALRLPGERLRALFVGVSIDVVDGVMEGVDSEGFPMLAEALAADIDVVPGVFDALDSEPVALRDVLPDAPSDLADFIFAGLDDADSMMISAFGDGEVSGAARAAVSRRVLRDSEAQAELQRSSRIGERVRAAASDVAPVDLWGAIADSIGADAGDAAASADLSLAMRDALGGLQPIDVAPEVMAAVEPRERAMPRWASLGAPIAAFAMAALVLLAVVPSMATLPGKGLGDSLAQVAPAFVLGSVNDAQVEDIETSKDVVAQVVQFDDGGPTFILVDESGENGGVL